ncbi:MAG: PH domain-containing protein, partial [Proteobacteria bacterium]|nr:PH domain-containing protein [Pseudomonadota bacterium]
MGYYPSLDELLALPSKSRLLLLHRSIRSSIGLISLLGWVVAAIILLAWHSQDMRIGTFSFGSVVRVLTLVPIALVLELLRRYYNDLYMIGRDKVTHYQGRVSLRLATPSVRSIDLRAITVSQGLMGRICDYGDVALATAAQEGPEIIMVGVRSPHELAKLIDELRQKSQRASFEAASREQVR